MRKQSTTFHPSRKFLTFMILAKLVSDCLDKLLEGICMGGSKIPLDHVACSLQKQAGEKPENILESVVESTLDAKL